VFNGLTVEMDSVPGAIESENAFVTVWADGVAESVTWTEKLNVPGELGVPVIAPVEEFKARPVGSEPEVTVQFV
jgi:hypothetical protein